MGYDSDDSHPSNLSVQNVFNPSEDIVLNIFMDIISTVIAKSTLQDDEKYVSDDSHPSNLSVANVFNPSENSEDDLLTNISTVLQGPKLSKDKKSVSKKKELKLTETATKFSLVQQKNIPTNTTNNKNKWNKKGDKCDRNY